MNEQPVTPEGEHHPDEPPTIVETPTVAEPSEVAEPPIVAEPAIEAEPPAPEPVPVVPPPPPPPPVIPPSPAAAAATAFDSDRPENAADRPEIQIGAAFAGGFLLALVLKRLAR